MLSFAGGIRIFLAPGPTDLRKGIQGLSALTSSLLDQDPSSGHLFVFCNRAKTTIKILFCEGGGFWLLQKRLSKGTFAWPNKAEGETLLLTQAKLWALLGGLDFRKVENKTWFQRSLKTSEKNFKKTSHLGSQLRTTLQHGKESWKP